MIDVIGDLEVCNENIDENENENEMGIYFARRSFNIYTQGVYLGR